MIKTWYIFSTGCLIAAIGLSGCQKLHPKKAEVVSERIKVDVTVGKAVRQTLYQERKLLGTLEAYRETDIAPLLPGRVKSLPVNIGDYVKQGQIVAQMDDAQLVATMAQFAQLKASYDRSRSLYESSAIPKAQFELVEGPYLAMKRQMENLEENTTLKAPFAGIVTARAVEEGELFSPGMTPGQPKGLVHITQLNPLKIDLDVDDQTVLHVKKGMKVRFTVDNMPDSAGLEGKIEWVNPQANSQSRMFSVRVIIQNPDLQLRPGYFAEVHIVLEEKVNALIIPREAIVDDRVFIVRDSMSFSNTVELGWLTDDYAEIVSGIEENDIVVLTGNKALPDSALVTIVKY